MLTREEFRHLHSCITVQEYQWMLRHIPEHSPYWLLTVLAVETGARLGELLRLRLSHFGPHWRSVQFRVLKPRGFLNKAGERLLTSKHREVVLDEWVAERVQLYLSSFGRPVFVDGRTEYVLPWGPGEAPFLFPFLSHRARGGDPSSYIVKRACDVVRNYYGKLRYRMIKDHGLLSLGIDSSRLETVHRREGEVYASCHVVRFHGLRHLAVTRRFYQFGGDLKRTQEWVCHERSMTTDRYVHSAEAAGTSPEFLSGASSQELAGYEGGQVTLAAVSVNSQQTLMQFC